MNPDERPGGEIRKVAVPAREITGGEPAIEAAADPASDARATSSARPLREVRAQYDDHTVTVYQAYREELARLALERQTLHVPGFGRNRTTWIKPSFTWMLYRSGYGLKESRQQRILALRVTREVFDGLLEQAALASFVAGLHGDEASWRQQRRASPVVVQWDPERTVDLRELPWRAIQIGVKELASKRYVRGIVAILDVTAIAHRLAELVGAGRLEEAGALLPEERPYPAPERAVKRLGIDSSPGV